MPHQLYISTLPTFTYKEYVDGHRIQCVKPKREEEKESENIVSPTFLFEPLKTFHRWNLRFIEKITSLKNYTQKAIIRGFIIKNEKQEHNYWLYILKSVIIKSSKCR